MLNSGNTCYVNSTLQALAALNTGRFAFESLQSLLDLCASHLSDARPLNPTGLFQLRSLLPRWRFDGRQQDASEFYTMLTSQGVGDLQAVQWQGRTDGHIEAADVGESPLLLPQSPDHTTLSQIVSEWSEGGFQRGLLWAPPLLAVVLGRWSAGYKLHTAVTLSEVSIPVWEEGQTRVWYNYRVRAGKSWAPCPRPSGTLPKPPEASGTLPKALGHPPAGHPAAQTPFGHSAQGTYQSSAQSLEVFSNSFFIKILFVVEWVR